MLAVCHVIVTSFERAVTTVSDICGMVEAGSLYSTCHPFVVRFEAVWRPVVDGTPLLPKRRYTAPFEPPAWSRADSTESMAVLGRELFWAYNACNLLHPATTKFVSLLSSKRISNTFVCPLKFALWR